MSAKNLKQQITQAQLARLTMQDIFPLLDEISQIVNAALTKLVIWVNFGHQNGPGFRKNEVAV